MAKKRKQNINITAIVVLVLIFGVAVFVQISLKSGSSANKIISSEVTVEGCKIKVVTDKGELFLETEIGKIYPESKCYQFLQNITSPSGRFVVFEDLSGGLDTQLRVYTLRNKNNQSHNLEVLGTSRIFSLLFIDSDKLAVLSGYEGMYSEQALFVYDLPGLYKNYPANLGQGVDLFTNVNQYKKIQTLEDIGKDYASMAVSEGKLKIYGTPGIGSEVLKEFDINEL